MFSFIFQGKIFGLVLGVSGVVVAFVVGGVVINEHCVWGGANHTKRGRGRLNLMLIVVNLSKCCRELVLLLIRWHYLSLQFKIFRALAFYVKWDKSTFGINVIWILEKIIKGNSQW